MWLKYTRPGQMVSMLITHIELSFLFFAIWLIIFSLTQTVLGGIIYTAVSFILFCVCLYSTGNTVYNNDKKSYSRLSPKWYQGAVLPLIIIIINIALLILYKVAWKYAGNGESLNRLWAVFVNMANIFWFSPYQKLVTLDKGYVNALSYIITFITPVVMCFLGYFAGYKNFKISKKLRFLVYDNKNGR